NPRTQFFGKTFFCKVSFIHMAKKTLGYIELYWRCPSCSNENLGSHAFCTSCGSPQPQNVDFHQASQQQLLKDETKIKQAKAGADVHCGFCGTRNPATAGKCSQCGSELKLGAKRASAGRVVGAFAQGALQPVKCANCGTMNAGSRLKCGNCGSPLKHGEPAKKQVAVAPVSKPLNRSTLLIIGAGVLLLCAAIYFLFLRTNEVQAAVTGVNWQRSVVIESFGFVELEAWRDEVPGDGAILGCQEEVRFVQSEQPSSGAYDEVCGTPYNVDTGSGFAEVVQDCEYHVYDDYCSYEAEAWAPVATVEIQGFDLSPEQPSPLLASNERLGSQDASYECFFESNDGNTYTYATDSLSEFQQCQIGSIWLLTINGVGAVVSIESAN
ncbi:MAG: zinc ribbon domain-containing protein, partial [Anaerolineales bacterium]